MSDDEASASTATAPHNPLTLDELTSFSRKPLNITFTLYWGED
jgi:ubiquitin-protein ligase E3 C